MKLVDMLVIGCRKKVVVFSGTKPGFKDAWVRLSIRQQLRCHSRLTPQELALPHSPRHLIVPSSSPRSPIFPQTCHLLYSATSSAILNISPSAPYLSVLDVPAAPPPSAISTSSGDPTSVSSSGSHEGGAGLSGMGVGALTGLGGYVGLGGRAAAGPVGCRTVGGEVLVGREGMLTYSVSGTVGMD